VRFLVMVIGLLAAFAGSYAAFETMRAVGPGHDPGYGIADLHGRRFTWPGRT